MQLFDDEEDEDDTLLAAIEQLESQHRACSKVELPVQHNRNNPPAAIHDPPFHETWRIPDIEDFGVAKDYVNVCKKGRLSVTDVAQGVKCQQRAALLCLTGIKEEQTASMLHGITVHDRLEAEATPEDAQVLPVSSSEDAFVGMLMDTRQKLKWIRQHGRARELRCIAKIKGVWLVGVIDEVQWDPSAQAAVIIDDKTRQHRSRPQDHLAATYKLQVMLYRLMFLQMQTLTVAELQQYAALRGVSLTAPLSLETQLALGYHPAGWQGPTAEEGPCGPLVHPPLTVAMVLQQFATEVVGLWPPLSSMVQVRYRVGSGEEVWATDSFEYDMQWLDGALTEQLQFWKGAAPPKMTRFKSVCYHCKFWRECPVGSRRFGNDAVTRHSPSAATIPIKRTSDRRSSCFDDTGSLQQHPKRVMANKGDGGKSVCNGLATQASGIAMPACVIETSGVQVSSPCIHAVRAIRHRHDDDGTATAAPMCCDNAVENMLQDASWSAPRLPMRLPGQATDFAMPGL